MTTLTVGFDARWYGGSGVGTYVVNLLASLAEGNNDLSIVAYEDPGNPLPISSPKIRVSPLRDSKYSIAGQVELARRCRQDRVQVFHAPFYVVPVLARCPIVVTVHDLIPFLFPIYGCVHRQLVKAGYRMAVHKAARIIAVSHSTAKDLCSILSVPSERVSMVYNAHAGSSYTHEGAPNELQYLRRKYGVVSPYVLTFSADNWWTKNLCTALIAIELARSQLSMPFQTVVAGPLAGLQATGLARQATNLLATGFVPAADLPLLYRNAAAFLAVSHYEGFGIPILEAMASGCPCITSTGGSLREIAGSAAAVFPPNDANGMATTLVRLLEDPEYAAELSRRGIRRAAEFTYCATAKETSRIYEQVAGQGQ